MFLLSGALSYLLIPSSSLLLPTFRMGVPDSTYIQAEALFRGTVFDFAVFVFGTAIAHIRIGFKCTSYIWGLDSAVLKLLWVCWDASHLVLFLLFGVFSLSLSLFFLPDFSLLAPTCGKNRFIFYYGLTCCVMH